jgi:hypothetical protein
LNTEVPDEMKCMNESRVLFDNSMLYILYLMHAPSLTLLDCPIQLRVVAQSLCLAIVFRQVYT